MWSKSRRPCPLGERGVRLDYDRWTDGSTDGNGGAAAERPASRRAGRWVARQERPRATRLTVETTMTFSRCGPGFTGVLARATTPSR